MMMTQLPQEGRGAPGWTRPWLMVFAILAFLGSIAVGTVSAHAELTSAVPAPGAQLPASPDEIVLTFTEPLAASSQAVLLSDFEPVSGQTPLFDPAQPNRIATELPPLPAGGYTVQWTAVSVDGHEITGSFSFSVAPEWVAGGAPFGAGWWAPILGIVAAVALLAWMIVADRSGQG